MPDLDYGRLREIAEAAPSESEWVAEPIGAPEEGPTNHLIYEKRAPAGERVQYLVAWTDYDEAGWRFSEYIAAFDPTTVIQLLDRIADNTENAERANVAEAKLALIRETLSSSPACDKYDEGDAITCGWKRDMQAVRAILDEGDR